MSTIWRDTGLDVVASGEHAPEGFPVHLSFGSEVGGLHRTESSSPHFLAKMQTLRGACRADSQPEGPLLQYEGPVALCVRCGRSLVIEFEIY